MQQKVLHFFIPVSGSARNLLQLNLYRGLTKGSLNVPHSNYNFFFIKLIAFAHCNQFFNATKICTQLCFKRQYNILIFLVIN